MKTITKSILMVMVALLVSWGLATNEVRAMASPCEELAALNNEAAELREEVARLDGEDGDVYEAWEAVNEASARYGEQCSDLGVVYASPEELERMAEEARARGDEERAELYESAAEALRPAWTELETLRNAWGTALTDLADARHRLWLIGLRRPKLMEECGIITEISDPMASFQRRVPRRTDPSPAPGGPYVSQPDNYDNQASGNKQPVGQLAAPIIPAKLVFPGFLKAINQQNSPEASPAATTAETMQVEQPASAKKGKRIFGYTHLSLGKKTDQFGANTARSRTLKISTPRRTMRVFPVRSIKQ